MPASLTRRQALAWAAGLPARLPRGTPPGVAAILARILNGPPEALNTDWFGTMPLVGALHWGRRGVAEVGPFARAWLDHHLRNKEVARYSGNR